MKTRTKLQLVLVVGVVVRFSIAPFTLHTFDGNVLKYACRSYFERQVVSLFHNWTNPPLLYYITIFSYSFYYLLHYKLGVPDMYLFYKPAATLEIMFLKLPFLLADIGSYILLYKSFKQLDIDEDTSLIFSGFFFLNPYQILISASWGMWDPLAAMFIILGFYLLSKYGFQKHTYGAVLAFTASFLVKWVGLAPLFVIFTLFLAKKQYRTFLKNLVVTACFVFLAYLPYVFYDFNRLKQIFLFRLGGTGVISHFHGLSYLQFFRFLFVELWEKPWIVKRAASLFPYLYAGFCLVLIPVIFYFVKKTQQQESNDVLFSLQVVFTALMIIVFLLLYQQINEQLFIFFYAVFPYLLALKPQSTLRESLQDYGETLALGLVLAIFANQGFTYMLFGVQATTPDGYPYSFSPVVQIGILTIVIIMIITILSHIGFKLSRYLSNFLNVNHTSKESAEHRHT